MEPVSKQAVAEAQRLLDLRLAGRNTQGVRNWLKWDLEHEGQGAGHPHHLSEDEARGHLAHLGNLSMGMDRRWQREGKQITFKSHDHGQLTGTIHRSFSLGPNSYGHLVRSDRGWHAVDENTHSGTSKEFEPSRGWAE